MSASVFNVGDLVRIQNRGEGWDGAIAQVTRSNGLGPILRLVEGGPTNRGYGPLTEIGPWSSRYLFRHQATIEPDETEAFFV